jgi:hypothetical protein
MLHNCFDLLKYEHFVNKFVLNNQKSTKNQMHTYITPWESVKFKKVLIFERIQNKRSRGHVPMVQLVFALLWVHFKALATLVSSVVFGDFSI